MRNFAALNGLRPAHSSHIWLDASNYNSSTGQWSDISGNNLHFYQPTAGSRPSVTTLNGRTAVGFNGSQFVRRSNAVGEGAVLAAPTNYTIFAVARGVDFASRRQSIISAVPGNVNSTQSQFELTAGQFFANSLGRLCYGFGNGGGGFGYGRGGTSLVNNTSYVFTSRYTSGQNQCALWINNVAETIITNNTTATSITTTAVPVAIGSYPETGSYALNGIIGEILVYYRALSDAEITQTNTYLRAKFGV